MCVSGEGFTPDLLSLYPRATQVPALFGHVLRYEFCVCTGNGFDRLCGALDNFKEHYRTLAVCVLMRERKDIIVAAAITGYGPEPVWVVPAVVKDEEPLKALHKAEQDRILNSDAIVLLQHL
jgi:hypothetical protein